MTETTEPREHAEADGEPTPLRLCLASYLLVEARRLVSIAASDAEADRAPLTTGGALTELDAIAFDLARAEARLHRLLRPRSP